MDKLNKTLAASLLVGSLVGCSSNEPPTDSNTGFTQEALVPEAYALRSNGVKTKETRIIENTYGDLTKVTETKDPSISKAVGMLGKCTTTFLNAGPVWVSDSSGPIGSSDGSYYDTKKLFAQSTSACEPNIIQLSANLFSQ